MSKEAIDRSTLTAFVVAILFGGLNGIGIRFMVQELPPFWSAVLRFAPACVLLFGLILIKRLPMPKGRGLTGAVIYGVVGFGMSFALANWGLQKALPGITQVILASVPLFTLLIAVGFRQETLNRQALAGAVVAISGIAVVFRGQIQTDLPWPYLTALLLSAICISFSNVYVKTFPVSHPITTSTVGMSAGTILLILLSLAFNERWGLPVQPVSWISMAYLVTLGTTLVPILFLFVLRRWKASAAAYGFVLMPFVTLSASALINRERLTLTLLAGAALVIAGTWYGALRPNGKRVPVEAPVPEPVMVRQPQPPGD